MTTRVMVVDDSSVFRRIVSDALGSIPGVEVVGVAPNGRIALERLASLKPDVITLDIEMPEMNGLEVLDKLRSNGVAPSVIVLSSRTTRGGEMTIRALEAGAFDFITKPDGGSTQENQARVRESLRPLIHALHQRREILSILRSKGGSPSQSPAPTPDASAAPRVPRTVRSGTPLALIGVSTGGPSALAQVIPRLPRNFGAPVLIVQHMPPNFTGALAKRLESSSAIGVKEGEDGEVALPGCAYIAPGGRHMKVAPGAKGEVVLRITDDPPELNCRPSVDYLFRSVALHFPGRAVAAILTGMGNDGAEGIRMLKRGGSFNIAQDAASCVVFGMPREAIATGAVDTVVPLAKIAETLAQRVAEVRR